MDKAGHNQQTSISVHILSKTEVEDVNSELGFQIICLNVKSSVFYPIFRLWQYGVAI